MNIAMIVVGSVAVTAILFSILNVSWGYQDGTGFHFGIPSAQNQTVE